LSKRNVLALFAVLVLAAGPAATVPTADDPEAWQGLTEEQVERVKAGEIVIIDQDTSEGSEEKRMIRAAMIFDRPLDEVYKMLRKREDQVKYLPDLHECDLVMRDEDEDRVDFHVKVLMFTIDFRLNHHYDDENYHIWWSLDPEYDNEMKRVDGVWKLYQLDEERTLARYGTWVCFSSLIPDFIMARLTRNNLPENLGSEYKYIQSGGTYTKPGFKEK